MDLERELRAFEVAWPETPAFRFEAPRRRRRPVAVVVLAAVVIAGVMAVPQSRGAVLRFLHLRGAVIERVDTLPAAQERPLAAGLGEVVTPARVPWVFVPHAVPVLHRTPEGIVSFLLSLHGQTVLVSEVRGSSILLKKLAAGATRVEPVPHGVWLSGAPHVFYFPGAPPRLAGNVLLVERGGILVRVEGPGLTKAAAEYLLNQFVRFTE
ncbi:MAG: hypothetical protein ACRDL2_18415 [Gaiellaceae bacterium]